jgi:hypothetical protein
VSSTALSFVANDPLPEGVAPPALHHLSGSPVRAAICDARLFAPTEPPGGGPAIAPIYGQLDRRLWGLPGVYCLLWDPRNTRPAAIYIGSSHDFFDRLLHHERRGWTHAVLLTGYGIGKAGAEQAESGLGKVLKAARPQGRLTPAWEALPTPWGADMPWHLFEPLVVLLDLCLRELDVAIYLDPRLARL